MANHTVTQSGTITLGDGDKVKMEISGGGDLVINADPFDNVDKIKIEFRGDNEVDNVIINLATFSESDLHIDIKHYDASDSITLLGAITTSVDPDDPDEFQFTYLGADGQIHTGFIHAKDGKEKDFTDPYKPIQIICFGDGTLIGTPSGEVPIEDLEIGDLVLTEEGGIKPIRWIGRKYLDSLFLARAQHLRPILVRAGALGEGIPHCDLILSPNHRVLLRDWRAEYLFGESEVLVAIKTLVNDSNILWAENPVGVTYYHILLGTHEVLLANGVSAESLLPGPMAFQSMDHDTRQEIMDIFPEFTTPKGDTCVAAQPILKGYEGTTIGALAA